MKAERFTDQLVGDVLKSRKYRYVCEELVRQIGTRELAVRRNYKEAVKTTKKKLHQVSGAYFEAKISYARAIEELKQAPKCFARRVSSLLSKIDGVSCFDQRTAWDS